MFIRLVRTLTVTLSCFLNSCYVDGWLPHHGDVLGVQLGKESPLPSTGLFRFFRMLIVYRVLRDEGLVVCPIGFVHPMREFQFFLYCHFFQSRWNCFQIRRSYAIVFFFRIPPSLVCFPPRSCAGQLAGICLSAFLFFLTVSPVLLGPPFLFFLSTSLYCCRFFSTLPLPVFRVPLCNLDAVLPPPVFLFSPPEL